MLYKLTSFACVAVLSFAVAGNAWNRPPDALQGAGDCSFVTDEAHKDQTANDLHIQWNHPGVKVDKAVAFKDPANQTKIGEWKVASTEETDDGTVTYLTGPDVVRYQQVHINVNWKCSDAPCFLKAKYYFTYKDPSDNTKGEGKKVSEERDDLTISGEATKKPNKPKKKP